MKTFLLLKILKNKYISTILMLVLLHAFFKVLGAYILPIDYVILVYLFVSKSVTDETLIQFSFIFGLFYDFLFDTSIGVGVILFLALSILKVRSDILFDMSKFTSRIAVDIAIIILYVVFNLQHEGYSGSSFFVEAGYYLLIDSALYAIIKSLLELNRAFSYSK